MATPQVQRCLQGIGLQHAWPHMEAAGIVTLAALSELPVTHFSALGVTDPADRRKLFYLVERIKLERKHLAEEASSRNTNTAPPTDGGASDEENGPAAQRRPEASSATVTSKLSLTSPSRGTPTRGGSDDEAGPASVTNRERSSSSDSFISKIPSPSRANTRPPSRPRHRPVVETPVVVPPTVVDNSKEELVEDDDDEDWKHEETEESMSEGEDDEETDQYDDDDFEEAFEDEDDDDFLDSTAADQPFKEEPPRRSRRLQKNDDATTTTTTAARTRPSTVGAPSQSRTLKNRRMSRLTTPKKRVSTVPVRNNRHTNHQARLPPVADISARNDDSEPETAIPTVPSGETVESHNNVRNDSFQAQIDRLRQTNAEEHELFGPKYPAKDPAASALMRIRVVVRKRPMSTTEIAMAGNVDVLHPLDYGGYGRVLVYQPKTRVDLTKEVDTFPFSFDNVFGDESNNAHIYVRAIRPLIPGLFEGHWATLFAYGQTGSGKTFTMMGSVHTTGASGSNFGLYYMAALDIFQLLRTNPELRVGVSLFEIYGGKLFDLLHERQAVKCLEDSQGQIHFPGLSERRLESPHTLMEWMHEGAALRSTGTTSRNADSSRSHAILQLHLRRKSDNSEVSRMTLIDLAGSERGADTSAACRTTRMEGAEINTSLLALKEVIRALANGDSVVHVPFRGSKLTQVLKESFVGSKCRSVMIACVSPNIGNCDQTLNTLRYANRVKERNPETGESSRDVAVPVNTLQGSDRDESEGALLDKLLASESSHEPPLELAYLADSPQKRARETIALHQEYMSTLWKMNTDEMDLALQGGPVEDYMSKLNVLHEQQRDIIATLRGSIQAYRKARGTIAETYDAKSTQSDDSFEDLRD